MSGTTETTLLPVYTLAEARSQLAAYAEYVETEPIQSYEDYERLVGDQGYNLPGSIGSLIIRTGQREVQVDDAPAYKINANASLAWDLQAGIWTNSLRHKAPPLVKLESKRRWKPGIESYDLLKFIDGADYCQIISQRQENKRCASVLQHNTATLLHPFNEISSTLVRRLLAVS